MLKCDLLCYSGLDCHFLLGHHMLGSKCMNYHANPEHMLWFFMVITPSQAQMPAFLCVHYYHNPAVLLCHCAEIGLKQALLLPSRSQVAHRIAMMGSVSLQRLEGNKLM